MSDRLPREHLARDVLEVAPDLLGCLLVHDAPGQGRVALRITETEAYAGEGDPGSHASRGSTPRTAVMFGPAGHAYVYFTYGMHWCLNIVTGAAGSASAVLVRAGEVVEGVELARSRRPGATDRDLARGPARLTRALGVGAEHAGADLCAPEAALFLAPAPSAGPALPVATGPRVGVSGPGGDGAAHPWRFWLDGDPSVSAYRASSRATTERRRPSGRLAP